ncbi:MAG: acetyltransferase [Anaerolinea sp.]|nr:acetyltransferase [Anaerolinea sp.]
MHYPARLLILGAGGHAKNVAEVALSLGMEIAGFLDDQQANWGKTFFGYPVLGGIDLDVVRKLEPVSLVVAIGNNRVRQALVEKFSSTPETFTWATLCHPRALISPSAHVGSGTVILPGAIINAEVQIGAHVIVGSGAIIDHECVVEDFAHIACGATLGGGVQISTRSLIDTGAIVKRLVRIAEDVAVQPGEVITNDTIKLPIP